MMLSELELKLKSAAQKYYTDGTSDLTDAEFDALVDTLRIQQPDSILFKVGWGYDVSEDTTPGMKRSHIYTTIGSLDKCHNLKELGKEFVNTTLDASTKLDGLSVVLYYENSLLKYALTRGDSFTGIDITDKILVIDPAFRRTAIPFTGAIRGEILMSYPNFDIFKEIHPEAKNPRNSTAGVINGKNTFDDLKYLDVVLYTLVHCNIKDVNFNEHTIEATRNFIRDLFPDENNLVEIVPRFRLEIPEGSDPDEFIHVMNIYKDRLYQEYPADGVVLSKENITCVDGTFEYVAKAFKFPAESKITNIIDVEWNMSRMKVAVPRLILEPIELSGTTVQACAGYHAQYIKENNLGPGSIVEVCKSGEIIPNVIRIHKTTSANIPTHCPECGAELTWEGVNLVCRNESCVNSIEQDLLVWLQNLVPLDNLGDTLKMKFINQLIDYKYLDDCSIESVMKCNLHLDENTNSVQSNNFAKMWNDLHDENVTFDLASALIACNIPRIGDITAVKFANHPDAVLSELDGTKDKSALAFLIGNANAESVYKHHKKLERLNFIRDRIRWKQKVTVQSQGKVAVTGKLSVKRTDFEKELRAYGWEVGDLTKDTKFLITDNPDGTSSKNQKATRLGISKITELEFRIKYLV